MESQRVVVVVEEAEASRAALRWAVGNFLRYDDSITLLHVYPSTRCAKRQKKMRLKGFQLALSFKELFNGIAEAKVEITVMEGDQADATALLVNKIRASTLIIGLHDRSFVYERVHAIVTMRNLGCRILAIKQHLSNYDDGYSDTLELSQVEITTIQRRSAEAKIPYRVYPSCPIWRISRKRERRRR